MAERLELIDLAPPEVEEARCDLCGAQDSTVLYTLSDALHHLPGEFPLRRCVKCGLMYLNPRPTPQSIRQYYPPDYAPYRPPIEDERFALMRYMRRRKMIKRRTLVEKYGGLKNGRVLDVGCATGLFLHEMQLAGWEAVGVEPIASAAGWRSGNLAEVFQGMLGDTLRTASFDAITFWDVLEHILAARGIDACRAFAKARWSRRGSMPNWDELIVARLARIGVGFDTPRHLYVFTRPTLTGCWHRQASACSIGFVSCRFFLSLSVQSWLNAKHRRWEKPVTRLLVFPGVLLFEPWFTWVKWRGTGPAIAVFARKE
jgi:SAM-dependent methyltransferase